MSDEDLRDLERRATLDAAAAQKGFAVDARGRVVLVNMAEGLGALVAIGGDGSTETLGDAMAGAPLLLAGNSVVHSTSPQFGPASMLMPTGTPPREGAYHLLHVMGSGTAYTFTPWIAGLGHHVFAKTKQSIEARQLPTKDAPLRWASPIPRAAADVAFGPGALVLVLTKSGTGARGSFHRFELATGRALPGISLERLGTVDGKVVGAEDGTVFLGLGGGTVAIDPEGKEKWRKDASGTPVGLAGEAAEVLIVSEPVSSAPFALDAATGAELWRSRDACLNGVPKIDARGIVYWRREQELVAFEPSKGEIVYQAVVGPGMWDFALAGNGRALCVCYGSREIIALE